MSLFGDCAWCDRADHLRFVPGRPMDEQTRPTICNDCYWTAKEQLEIQRQNVPYDQPQYKEGGR